MAKAVIVSVPGARPSPEIDPSRVKRLEQRNVSAILSGAWFGSITPPAPSRIRAVWLAMCSIMISGAPLASPRGVVVLGVPDPVISQLLGELR